MSRQENEEKIYIGAKVTISLKRLLEKVCKARGEKLSSFIRRSLKKELASLGFCSEDEKKALGVE